MKAINGKEQTNYKLTDAEFWTALRNNGGLFARTARAIERLYGVSYTRQAVQKRATASPEALAELEDITEEALDAAEEGLLTLIRTGQPSTRLEAIKFYLKTKAKHRGYGDKPLEITATTNANEPTEEATQNSSFSLTIKVAGKD